MFKVQIDFILQYSPPMSESSRGISLTREVELPFPPAENLAIYSTTLDDLGSEPLGFCLKDITWDMDRKVFLAKTSLHSSGLPITEIPNDLSRWLDMGWLFGSYVDSYATEEDSRDTEGEPGRPVVQPTKRDLHADDEHLDALLKLPSSKRSAYFNQVFGTMIRTMAESYADEATAYAMDKTGMYFAERELQEAKTDLVRRWRDIRREYEELTFRRKQGWRTRVMKAHYSIQSLVNGIRASSGSKGA